MVFVTGGTGLIGSHLLFELASKNYNIKALKRKDSNVDKVLKVFRYYSKDALNLFKRINWVEGDLRDKYLIHSILSDVVDVYHCAGYISFNNRKKEELYTTNILGTGNLIDACNENKINKFCYVSSIATLGYEDGSNLIDEKTRWKPDKRSSYYSITKFKAEMEVWRGFAEGLNTIIVNPSVVLGPGFWKKGVGSMLKKIQRGFNYYTEGSTGYVDVRDVARIMLMLMEKDISGEQFILSAENLNFKQIIEYFSKALKHEHELRPASKFMAGIIWRSELLRSYFIGSEPLITQESAKIAFESNVYSNKKIREFLDYDFIPIKDTIKSLTDIFIKETSEKVLKPELEEAVLE